MLINVLDQEGFAPKALSLLVAPTDPNFYDLTLGCPAPCDYANHPAEGVSGPSQWEVGVGFTEAIAKSNGRTWYGPEQDAFLDIYHKFAGEGQSPSYHAANGAVMMLSLALAIEKAQSLDTDKVRAAFDETDFTSFWGRWDVDETGANIGHAMVEVQWQQGVKQIVWPEDGKTASFTYPINN
jgi:branched-chain amino acid transport system substrate-binding protein